MTEDWKERFAASFPGLLDWLDGDDQKFSFSVKSIHLIGGAEIPLQQAGVTAIVGANNAGKSTALRETWQILSHQPHTIEQQRIAVERLELSTDGNEKDLIA